MPPRAKKRLPEPFGRTYAEFWHPKIDARMAWIRQENPKYAKLFERIYTGKARQSECVKGQCLDCCNFQPDIIRDCRGFTCTHYLRRPYQK